MLAALEAVPDAAIGPDAGAGEAALEHRQGLELAGRERVAVQPVAAVAELEQEHRAAVRPPVGDLGQALPRQRDVGHLPGFDVPDRRRPLAAPLVADSQARIAGNGGPAERAQRLAVVVELGLDRAAARVQDTE